MSGHVFVQRGDLTKLACDGVLIPTDAQLNVTRHWRALLPPELIESSSYGGWLRVEVAPPEGWGRARRALELPGTGRLWLVETGAADPTAPWIADGVRQAVRLAGPILRASESARAKPLLALPLPGAGDGGLRERRGEVIEALLPALRSAVHEEDVDIVLVLGNDRDHAAVQARRGADGWSELGAVLETADDLGLRLARGEVSLFLGAGVSVPLRLPSWPALVDQLWGRAGLASSDRSPESSAEALQDDAERAANKLGHVVVQKDIAQRFTTTRHTLAHGLLAGLRVQHVVTTNYDDAYELAAAAVYPEGQQPKVLTRGVAEAGRAWLLKLHGDVHKPETIVLTRSQYEAFTKSGVPLRGMVQSLLMTGHLVFVGYSLVDSTFASLAQQVRDVLRQAEEPRGLVGTVLPIRPDPQIEQRCGDDLHYVPMNATDDAEGARLLEVFLDRMCWSAAVHSDSALQYLLDAHYAAVEREPEDEALQQALLALIADLPTPARRSAGWPHVAQALRRLGADDLL